MKKQLLISGLILTNCIFSVPMSVYADTQENFIKDLQEGISARWEYNEDVDETTLSQDEYVENRRTMVNKEYEKLQKYKEQTFDNEKFNILAHAYIDALECQINALDYYTEATNIHNQLWDAGYNVRSILIPDFIDSYGLQLDGENVQEFRDQKELLNSPYTVEITESVNTDNTSTDDNMSASSIDTSNVNLTESKQEPIEIYNNDGIKVTISKYERTSYGSAKLYMDVVNLYHKDIIVSTSNYNCVINGTTVNASPYGDIASGKTGVSVLEIYTADQLNISDTKDIKSIDFKLTIYTKNGNTQNFKDESGEIYLDVNNDIVTQRVVYTDKENIQKVQQLLATLGYNTGSVDGVPGQLTNNAILQFERDHGLEENTDITPALIEALEQFAGQQ